MAVLKTFPKPIKPIELLLGMFFKNSFCLEEYNFMIFFYFINFCLLVLKFTSWLDPMDLYGGLYFLISLHLLFEAQIKFIDTSSVPADR